MRPLTALARTAARLPAPVGALLLLTSIPVLLLHADYQPSVSAGSATFKLSDLAILLLFAAALARLRRDRVERPDGWKLVAVPAAALLAWVVVGLVAGAASGREYATGTHLVTAAGFVEYALLAVATFALVRSEASLRLVLWVLTGWLAVLDLVALAGFAGWGGHAGIRQPSWIGYHDYAVVGAVALVAGLGAIALGARARLGRLPAASCFAGSVGLVLSGSVGGAAGFVAAVVLLLVVGARLRTLDRRRFGAVAAVTGVTLLGVLALRGGDIGQFARFAGLLPAERTTSEDVQTYSQRTLLGYYGLRVFGDHPVLGAGWQATQEYATLEPYTADAHRRFPDVAEQAFPSPAQPYGVQNAYVQALSDLGLPGLLLFLSTLLAPVALAVRAILRGAPALLPLLGAAILLAAAGGWTAQGLVAGLPLDAVTWFGIGLVLAGLPTRRAR